ncbi:hypothetical protein [Hymenobacter cavernae]|uniref:Tetratricopeptide repeat protein n=1 Tax=Hymenobacter cavernae TaxID=2044852 RepID=A0ABQ1TU35_9BACT|nr:hypothetical protein [Hymenobacter cavernae]GGF03837.1 hypothetical protein GCM10011383_13620 [Hymenobacter cavernae]
MKKFFLLLALGSSTVSFAQSSKFQSAIEQNLAQLDTASTAAGFQKIGATFERIANAEKSQWLPYYYASYCGLKAVKFERDLNQIDAKLDKIEILTQQANTLSPNNSEIYCLNALISFARINVDFMARGPEYSALANKALQTAKQLNPANPRAYLLFGQSKYSTPPQFGGDRKLACQYFEKANSLFANAPASSIEPHWGKSEAVRYQGLCQSEVSVAK